MIKRILKILLCVTLCVVLGFGVGTLLGRLFQGPSTRTQLGLNKLDALLNLIDTKYVEEIDEKAIIEKLMPEALSGLDPHSVYIPAEEMAKTNEEIEGSFSGVGIQFNIREDTIRVVAIVHGGPAEKAGMKAGDRIVLIDDSAFVGKHITNDLVLKTLRGEKHSKVSIGVVRNDSPEILSYNLVRDDIPVNSIDASYRIGDGIAYVKIGSFSRTTYGEFLNCINRLKKQEGCDRMIIDLRSNPGGLMGSALAILNELLPKRSLMLYVEGRAYPREDSYSDGRGCFMDMPVVVLTDEWSASASEIVAGAIQDNDRGYIVGRRSYGKGLVQQQIPFKDGSAVRLTVAHYYIPSGRCVQKPYKKGDLADYEMDLVNRYDRGEFVSADSIRLNDSLRFETMGGRTVYGGGGIMPDFFIPIDTTAVSHWFTEVVNRNLVYLFAAEYADNHRSQLNRLNNSDALVSELKKSDLLEQFVRYAERKGVKADRRQIAGSRRDAERQLYAYVARNILGDDDFWKLFQADDPTLSKAVELIRDAGVKIP